MASPYRRPNWFSRQRRSHPMLLALGFVCAALVIVEIAAVTDAFGLLSHPSSSATTPPPNLNPNNETILKILAEITGGGATNFPALEDQNLCPISCPELPKLYLIYSPPEVGVYFFFNVTNTAASLQSISQPVLGISGSDQSIFVLETFCCYTTLDKPYSEPLTAGLTFSPSGDQGSKVGLEGYVYTSTAIPANTAKGYTLYFNVTSG